MSDTLHTELRSDGVAIISIDVPGKRQNVVHPQLAEELAHLLTALKSQAKAVVLASRKPGSFMAGADLEVFRRQGSRQEIIELCRQVQRALNQLEACPIPVWAAIDGVCLGGGLEVALACHGRVASDGPATRLALPEVQLGLVPGAGGSQRIVERVGLEKGLDLLLTGRRVGPKEALEMGLVDEVAPAHRLLEVAARRALSRAHEERPRRGLSFDWRERKRLQELAISRNPVGRNLVFRQAERAIEKKGGDGLPAPRRLLEVVRTGLEKGRQAGFDAEAEAMADLAVSDVADRLIELFFARQAVKREGVAASPLPVRRVAVLGAGPMGRGIAQISVERAGLRVRLKDRDDAAVGAGLQAVHQRLQGLERSGRMSAPEVERTFMRLTGTTEDRYAGCDLVIEAVFEDLELKQRLLAQVEAQTPDTTIFATNTSSIPVAQIAEASRRKDRVVGMHYFSPAEKMPLLEVVRTAETSEQTVATAVAVGQAQGKLVIVVRDGVGFYTSRILVPYLNEAAWMLTEGISVELIDEAARRLGFPVGPCTLLDEVGIDVAAKVARIAESAYGTRMHPPGSLDRLLWDGRTGRKGEKGFYRYGGPNKTVDPTVYEGLGVTPKNRPVEVDVLKERLLLMMVQEAIRCFDEEVVRSARDADVGAVYGLGFPAHLGGPLRWVDSVGPAETSTRMRALMDRFGGRFQPPPRLESMARSGERFHPDD